jgi:hypothetical protein
MNLQIYLDLDDVLCDFKKAVKALGEEPALGLPFDASDDQEEIMFRYIEKAGEPFWSDMSWMPDGKDLWEMFRPFRPTILTSVGPEGRLTYAKSGKLQWVKRNIPGTPVFFSDSKSEYVNPYVTCILIDDNRFNIDAWNRAGGIGFLHVSAENTERQFLELLWNQDKIDTTKLYQP